MSSAPAVAVIGDGVDEDEDELLEPLEGSLMNVVEQKSLKWIFVGGKGGVGKTTTSCALAVALAKARESVLIISTDPAHNISDAFGQKFGKSATKVNGFDNIFAMEIDPKGELNAPSNDLSTESKATSDLLKNFPGVDEALSFAELMKQVQTMDYDVIVFDTAPTGHTLRLLTFPGVLQKMIDKVAAIRDRFSGLVGQLMGMIGGAGGEADFSKIEQLQKTVEEVNKLFRDPDSTTFVCVAIPEFLSLFETERLVQALAKHEIDTHNLVVNQVHTLSDDNKGCKKCAARWKMQSKYLDQIRELYDDFNVTVCPLLDEEVRGKDRLVDFAEMLVTERKI